MHARLATQSWLRALRLCRTGTVCAIAVLAAGCEIMPSQEPQAPAVVMDDNPVRIYLETMSALSGTDAAQQADVFYAVEREYTRAPTTASTLRYAVALVTAGHPAANAAEGKRLLETLLATPERMTPDERTLTKILLHETNERLKLEAENRRLLATLDDRGKSQANWEKRLQAQAEENARLKRALTEAQQKLDAIKEIERSIIERSPTPPGNRDTSSSETQSSSTRR
jgi:uncharacterized protein